MAAFRHFFTTVMSKRHGRFLVGIWAGYMGLSVALQMRGRKGEKAAAQGSSRSKKIKNTLLDKESLQQLARIIKPHILGKQGALLVAYVAVLCSRIFITVKLADLGGATASYLGARKWSAMFSVRPYLVFGA